MDIDFPSLYVPYTFDMHFITIFVLWAHDYELYGHCILFAKYATMTFFSVTLCTDCDFKIG